ncbi:hypothetical protein [Desmospora profundinema]|uniref:Acyl carrier protein n=1 Tax=Desmospora profundinema TaxID=1571184 RepID=A0ABU1IP76_9BACL|nr:hypothetical protein [Desmospora profundinema]MDR6226591.1 acyl carrier protein [Desmospora profundinema]
MTSLSSDKSVEYEVRRALREIFGDIVEQWDGETPIQSLEIRYDSATVMECIAVIEERFDIMIDIVEDYPTETFVSVNSITILVEKKLADLKTLREANVGMISK